jgi:predicted TIM-barrel fold metal-dependent hydrolase
VLDAHIRPAAGVFAGYATRRLGRQRCDRQQPPDMRPHLYERADFRAGLARLAALGLSFDAWLYHPQLTDVVSLARAVPGATIIMGHVGGVLGYGPYAGKTDEVFASWKRSMTELTACLNVVVKLGGMMRGWPRSTTA